MTTGKLRETFEQSLSSPVVRGWLAQRAYSSSWTTLKSVMPTRPMASANRMTVRILVHFGDTTIATGNPICMVAELGLIPIPDYIVQTLTRQSPGLGIPEARGYLMENESA